MSIWTKIHGVIAVSVPGRTQHECDYILRSILDHLPVVEGSEGDMEFFINLNKPNVSCSHDEYGFMTNNLTTRYGRKGRRFGWLSYGDTYTITISSSLRDMNLSETLKQFNKWICRLAKRLMVCDVIIRLQDDYSGSYIIDNASRYFCMYEWPSWCKESGGKPAWWEHLMWDNYGDWSMPLQHVVKYYNCDEADGVWEKELRR